MVSAVRPRCRTSLPATGTAAAPAAAVRIRPAAIAASVPASLAAIAAGAIRIVVPGGCTVMKSRYGMAPPARRSALPKSAPSSYSVAASRCPGRASW
jgi:hypothetical protein